MGGEIVLIDPPQTLKLRYGQREVAVEYQSNSQLERRRFPLDGLADNGAFLATLRQHHVETIHTQETTLERIFIQVTGRGLS